MIEEKNKTTKWELPGVPAGGLRRVGQIRATNTLILHAGQNGMLVALELLSIHTPGAPVVDDRNEFIGFISEFDVLRALEAGKDLSKMTAEDIMVRERIAATAETTCLVPRCAGVIYSQLRRDDLWDRYCMEAPARQRRCVERYNRVKRA